MEVIGLIAMGLALVVTIRIIAGSLDGERVERYIADRGWRLVSRNWDPFGPGWFGEKNARIYRIVYEDNEGNIHRAHVKTSMFSGVYLTNDQVIRHAEGPAVTQKPSLAEENRRLRERIRELEDGRL
jgi:hypothetical protein